MNILTKSVIALPIAIGIAGCGGGGGGTAVTTTPATFSLASGSGSVQTVNLNAAAKTTGKSTGTWSSTGQSVGVGGQTLAAMAGDPINAANTYVRKVATGTGGETLVFSATPTANVPTGAATYNGTATLVITDGAGAAAGYKLTGAAAATATFASNDLDLAITGLTGTKTASAAGPQAFAPAGASVAITDMTLTGGVIGSGAATAATITGVDTVALGAGTAISAAGGLAGPAGEEIAGAAVASDADTILLTTFAGKR